jgi:hypothetical protein
LATGQRNRIGKIIFIFYEPEVGNPQTTTHGSVGPTDPFGVVRREVDHKFISLRSFAMDKKFRTFSDIPRTLRILYTGQVFVRKDREMGEI